MNEETQKIIDKLKTEYKDDREAIELIDRCIIDIEYVERKEADGNYDWQPSIGHALGLERHLKYWS